MTNLTSNILPFPIRHSLVQTGSQPLASGPTTPRTEVTGNKSLYADEEYREHVACIVGVAIRAGRRKGRDLSSLQPQLRKWLIELCDQGDPAAVMVHDWLTGNHRLLPPDFDRNEAQRQRTTKHDAEMGEGV